MALTKKEKTEFVNRWRQQGGTWIVGNKGERFNEAIRRNLWGAMEEFNAVERLASEHGVRLPGARGF